VKESVAAHGSTAKSTGKSLEVSHHQWDGDLIGHPSSHPSTPEKMHKADVTLLQPDDSDVVLPTPAFGLMVHALDNESDVEVGAVQMSNEEIGCGVPRVPPEPIQHGAIAVPGPYASNDSSVNDFTVMPLVHPMQPEESATETPISAIPINPEEEHQQWQEEIRNNAPMAEVVNFCGCSAAESCRYRIAGIIAVFVLVVVIIGVIAGLLARPGPEPSQLEMLLSSVSLDGGAAL